MSTVKNLPCYKEQSKYDMSELYDNPEALTNMSYSIKPLAFKPPRLIGLSEDMLVSHYENNYGGAIRRLNTITDQLESLDWSSATGFEINGIKREELIAANSMILHEVYFDSIGGEDGLGSPAVDPYGELADAITRDFDGIDQWRQQFSAMGKALGGCSGWVILSWSDRKQRLENQWAADHTHTGADGVPIVALDMYEHSYHTDFGANAGAYVDAFMDNLHWGRAARRFSAASGRSTGSKQDNPPPAVSPESLQEMLSQGETPLLLDVCLLDDLVRRHDKLPGATCWKSEEVSQSIMTLKTDKPIVAYCMYGFQVSSNAAEELRQQGFDTRILSGGISAWRAIGGSTEPYQSS